MWSPLKGSGFDLGDSSMSAAVQELYAGLPAALSAKCSVLSDPTLVLDAEPEAPAFVLSCSSGLPSEHQRTYELKLCSPDSHESSDYVGQMPGPTLVEILSREPAGTVVLAGNEETQDGSSAEQESLSGQLREDAEAAKSPRGVVEEGLSCFAPASEAACWSKEAEPRLIQEGRECLPRPFHAERAGSLQSLEESQANSQVAAENPMKEAPGRKANRTVLFGKAGASSLHVSPGVPPGTRECSEVEAFMAEVEVSETSTLVSLEPFTVVDDALAKERLRGEEECQRPKAATASALSVSEAGGEKLLNQDQECGAALGHILPSHQEKMNLYDNSSPASDLENRDTLPSGTVSQMSNCQLFQGGLELGCILWEEEMDVIEVVCETQEESPLGDERCSGDAAPCAETPLLETWASLMSTGRSPLATYSGMDSDTEQEVGKRTDHSYSCAWEGNADVEKDNAMQSYWKETQAGSCSENCQQELQVCQFSKEQNTHSETDTSCRLGVGHSSPEGHSDDDLESTISGSDSVQRNHVQQYSLPKDGNLASALEGSASPGEKAGNSVCFPSGCTVSTFSLPACRVPFSWDRRSCEEPLQPVESASSQRTLISSSATSLPGVHSPGTAGVHLVSREEILPIAQHSVAHSFPPGSGMISSPAGFLDSLPKEELSGTCAELGRQGAACLLCNEKAGPNCGGCTDGSRESQQCAAPGLCTMEERMVGTPTVESNKCSPTDQRVSGPCSAAKHDWIILESVCLDDHVLKMRTETTTEHVGGLETCHPLVHTKIAGPPLERSGFEAQDSPSYQNNQRDLDGAENNSASLCSMLIGSTALSGAEGLALDANVEGEKKANDSCRNAEEILDVDTHFGPPDTNLEQGLIAVSLVAGPSRTEAEESGKGKEDNHRNGANEKPRDCGRMGETVHRSELGRLVKDQGKEDEVPVHPPDHLYSTCSWNREVETPEREVLKDQQHLSMISSWPARDGAAQAVTCSETQKSPSCSQDEFLGLQSNGIVTPQPAPVLVTPNDTQQNMTVSCFSNETASESVSDPLEGEPVELKNSEPHLECVSEWKEWTDEVKIGHFCSASQSVEASPADVQEEMHSLMLFKSESASPSDQTYLHRALFAGANGQNSIEGGSSGMCQNQKLSSPTCIILGAQPAQNPGTSLSRKDDPSISLYPSVLCYPPTPRYPVPTRSEGDHHVRSLTSGDEKGSHSPQVGSCVGSPPHSKEVPRSMIGSNAGTVIGGEIVCTTPSNVNLSRKMAPSLEVHLRGSSQEARKVDLPFGSNAVDSSGPSSQCLKQAAGEGVPFLPEAEACPRLPFNSSELGLSNEPPCVKDTPKIVTLMGSEDDSEDAGGHAWHSKGLLPIGSPGVLRSGVPWASPGGMSEASPKCFRSHERHRQCTERSREQAGVKRKSSSHLFSRGIEVPVWITRVSEMGDRPELAAKALRKEAGGCPYRSFDGLRAKPKGDHRMKSSVGQPLCGSAGKPEAPAQQAFAVGHITEGRKSKSAWSTLQESKRPKISKDSVELDCLEAGSSRLSEKNCGWTSTDSNAPLAPVFNKQTPAVGSWWDRIGNAFGSAHKTRPSLASSRPPRKVWGKRSGLVQFKAGRKSTPVRSSACLKSLLEVVPLPQSKRVDRASSAVWRWAPKPRASRNRLLDSVGFGRLAKDQAVLRRLSLLADKLLAPPRNPGHLKPPSHSTKLLPLTGHCRWLSSQKLLDIFSCVNLPLNSWGMNDSNRSLKTLSSPPLTLFLVESLDLCFWDLGHQAPLSISTPLVPILFHMKVGLFPGRSLLGITSLQNQVVMGKRDATVKPWSWMLSFLFPGSRLSAAPVEEGAWTPTDSSLCAEKDRREDTTVQRSTGLPIHGLQTILALSSPRCHRLWMKKQPLSARRTLATQKLTMLQFIQGLKGSNCSSPATADFSSSVSHSLGRGLSLWSQHSPSTHPFEFPPLCSNHYTWPPVTPAASSLGIRNRITPDTSAASFHFANVQQRSGLKTPGPGCNPQFHLNQSPRLQFSAPLLKNNPHGKHPAMLLQVPDRIFGAPWFVASAVKVEPPLPASLLTPCLDSEPALSSLGLSTSEFQVRPLDGLDISLPVLPKTGSCLDKADSEKKPKKVSQIRIRKTIPKPDPNLTPMGLPRPKRLKKKEFSLEEIYTNKNYKSPPTTRCLETIFEEPKEKNGSLISVSQQKRKRILEFQDFTIPRKRRVRSRVKVLGSFTRAQKAALEGRELDVLLIQKLTDLETFFAKEEEKEQAASS